MCWSKHDKDRFFYLLKIFYWNDSYLFKYCSNQIFRRCIPSNEIRSLISLCYNKACRGHLSGRKTAIEVSQCGLHWPPCSRMPICIVRAALGVSSLRKISRRDMIFLNLIIIVKIFDVGGIDFMGQFASCFGNKCTLLNVDYMSKWMEAMLTRTTDTKIVGKFLRENIFV